MFFCVSPSVFGEVALLDLLALRIDGSRHQRTLASPPPHCLSGSLDLAPQFHGFPEWQLLVVLGQVQWRLVTNIWDDFGTVKIITLQCVQFAGEIYIEHSNMENESSSRFLGYKYFRRPVMVSLVNDQLHTITFNIPTVSHFLIQ